MRLSSAETRMASVVARVLLPPGSLGGTIDAEAGALRFAAQLERAPWWSALAIRAGLWLLWLAPLRAWPPRAFERLDEPERVALCERLAASHTYPVREAVMLVKLSLCMALLGDERVLGHLRAYDLSPPLDGRLGGGA